MFSVFRASGPEFASTHNLETCSLWLRGVPSRPGKSAPKTSGFSFPLPDSETSLAATLLVRTFLEDAEHWLAALQEQGIRCEIDIGMTVGGEEAFTASVSFEPSFLAELAGRQIGLVCSAYPSSD
jgi:hypothetical protein